MSAFASGKNAWGVSDRSGRRYRLREMKREWNGLLVGPDEFESKHPQLNPRRRVRDPQALKNARPDRREPFSVTLGAPPLGTGPFVPVQAHFKLADIERLQALGLGEAEIETLTSTLDREVDVWLLVGGQYAINGLKWALTGGVWNDDGAWVDDAIWSENGDQVLDAAFELQELQFYKEALYSRIDSFETTDSGINLDVTGLEGFGEYLVRVHGLRSTWGPIGVRTSSDGGVSYDSGAEDYSYTRLRHSSSSFAPDSATASDIEINPNVFSAADVPFLIEIRITANSRQVLAQAMGSRDTTSSRTRTAGVRRAGGPVNAVRLRSKSIGSFPAGVTVEVYGVN